ncbi:MAG: hypothetical protein U0794_00195 [Isosphaeraceae bacterium]
MSEVGDRVSGRAGEYHGALRQAVGHLRRPLGRVVGVGEGRDARVGAAQGVHALAGACVLADEHGRGDGRSAPSVPPERATVEGTVGAAGAAAERGDDELGGPAQAALAVVDRRDHVGVEGVAGAADVVEHLELARQVHG